MLVRPMRRDVLLSLAVVAMFTQSLCAISREALSQGALIPWFKDQQEFAIHTPKPQYPAEAVARSEEHTSELQSLAYLVCRLLLEKKKKKTLDLSKAQTQLDL